MVRDTNESHIEGRRQTGISLQVTPFTTMPTFKAFLDF